MSILCLSLATLLTSGLPAAAQQWQQQGNSFVLSIGQEQITYTPPGTLSVGTAGKPAISVAIFLWHDAWVYERLDGGQVATGPARDERGWIRQTGTWVVREGAPPMKYELALEPTATGAIVHLGTEKTAALKLTSGLWCTISLDRLPFAGRQVYARPTAHGPVGTAIGGMCDALLIGLGDGKAAAFAGEGFRELRSRISEKGHGFEMNLHPADFGVGEKVRTALKIGFEKMPAEFPGDVKPRREKLEIAGVTPTAGAVAQYGKLELNVSLKATWDNPYDPDDVSLDAVVTTASGRELKQPGFFTVDQKREVSDGAEIMVPVGNGRWVVRVATTEPGPLRCRLVARDRSGTVTKDAGPFTVQPGANKGFLRQSKQDARYLQFDNGAGFLPIGHNLPIYHGSGQLADEAIRKMAAKGENWNRWWMSAAGLGIEWEPKLGWYRQAQAARLDYMLDLGAELGFYYMLCMDTHQDFREDGWKANPFNQANGGPCATVSDWFTNEQARALYKKRLRYTVARWGYSPNVLCWEFGNEFEGWADATEATKIAWHREMAAHLAALDPYRHLITTSWWSKTGPEPCWQIPEMDIVQTHCYTNNDGNVAEQVRDYCLHQWSRFEKPHIFGEFGIRSHSTTADKDPKGWGLHNANWVSVCSGCCGIPMPWWHENYIEPLDLYFHFTAVANFVKDVPFGTAKWEQVTAAPPEYVTPPAEPIVRDIVLTPVSKWGKPEANEFTVAPDGSVNDAGSIHELLQGQGHKDLVNPPTFAVNFPRPGKFAIGVGRVSNSGQLKVWMDDELKLDREFPCGENIGKEWKHQPQWNLWESVYDEDVSLDIPAGKHRIRVENLGKDWMRISRYVFTGCKVIDRPNLLVAAIRSPELALLWVQNRDSDWFNHHRAETGEAPAVAPVPSARVTLEGFPDGAYQVEWWDTWEGKPAKTEQAVAKDGKLVLVPGEVATDRAAKIVPRGTSRS
jgi:hypothetical protein